ncbi:MAG TPA: hypothetical protein VMJ12_16075 [Candidatus Acidoferrales bacterium]|nr:hypothetical protein [Candidatus Acidoferrales bacterium]
MSSSPQEKPAPGATIPGLLACGLRRPDATCQSYSFDEMYPREHLEDMLHQLAGTMTWLAGQGLAPHRLTWTFEQGQIVLIPRMDGALLALATQPNTEAAESVDQLVEEFFSLTPGN